MIRIFVYIQNADGDGALYRGVRALTFLPAMPRKGDTVYMSNDIASEVISAILRQPKRVEAWRNLIVEDADGKRFLSIQEYFRVEDVWFDTNDYPANILMGGDRNAPKSDITADVSLIEELRTNFEAGKMWY